MIRGAVGLAIGAVVGAAVVAVVVLTKFGPLVNTPRSAHGVLIAALIALPALIGGVAGYTSSRAT